MQRSRAKPGSAEKFSKTGWCTPKNKSFIKLMSKLLT